MVGDGKAVAFISDALDEVEGGGVVGNAGFAAIYVDEDFFLLG